MKGNDQGQRTFVYLRQLGGGRESGYARAEMKERMVGLHIAVQGFAPQDEAYAFAVTDEGVVLLGRLLLDARGQGGLSAQLSRREYGDIQVLFVLKDGQSAAIPLAGTPGRRGWVDWEQTKALAMEALRPTEAVPEEEKLPEVSVEEAPVQEPAQEVPVPAMRTAEPEINGELYDLAAQEEPFAAVERELRTPIAQERRVEMPQLLRNAYWPQQLWPLHDLFERFEEVSPFAEQKDCAYIRVPLDGTYGTVEHYLIGARVRDGWVTAVGYLIPGTEERPIGIAGSAFADGYWQLWQDAQGAE